MNKQWIRFQFSSNPPPVVDWFNAHSIYIAQTEFKCECTQCTSMNLVLVWKEHPWAISTWLMADLIMLLLALLHLGGWRRMKNGNEEEQFWLLSISAWQSYLCRLISGHSSCTVDWGGIYKLLWVAVDATRCSPVIKSLSTRGVTKKVQDARPLFCWTTQPTNQLRHQASLWPQITSPYVIIAMNID